MFARGESRRERLDIIFAVKEKRRPNLEYQRLQFSVGNFHLVEGQKNKLGGGAGIPSKLASQ